MKKLQFFGSETVLGNFKRIQWYGIGKTGFPINYFLKESEIADGTDVEVANSYNDYYNEVGRKLAQHLPPTLVLDDYQQRTAMCYKTGRKKLCSFSRGPGG